MNLIEQPVFFAGNDLLLNNQRSIYWQAQNALIFSDLHSGKSAHFRKHGMAIPSYLHYSDLERLQFLIQHYQPKQIIIVGDLIHAANNKEVIDLKRITSTFSSTDFHLIKGNHDRISEKLIKDLGIASVTENLVIDTIQFVHEPSLNDNLPTISGHIHPGIQIPLLKNSRKKLPCFVLQSSQIILPAFSKLTGLDTTKTITDATYYSFHEEGFFKIKY
ncbi:ligase-associated DNA damage response endonuclease PdeM [Paenimyroides baculatum]|uniref:Ligase-associated DNA damage response endonuclease PdeM n=1 Tax=Paenimyroides baculatum TaxID=2608000 RepID=A0A5M6CRW2_9FLAO|nr:ligase-associated DNA damage response endonuclease PdeM [Paenimyroides baculatum]KAA5535869.1 ligase-associated DNA damage response endonuclease PdeM [Paenimyroides baculatum]